MVSTAETIKNNLALACSGVLRFITAGSVDDGKSTLIGRLLVDSKGVFADQLAALARVKHKRTTADTLDLSLLTDGLEAEREQGITIDVAYRYFATARRKFIVADTPGHEQYTRNMVTGASTADAAIILIDASKINPDGAVELLTQTKRHSTLAHLLRIKYVIAAVNKMDLLNYEQAAYERIAAAYRQFAQRLGLAQIQTIPLSALHGDNVVSASANMHWYSGPTLLTLLESLEVADDAQQAPLRFPVQLVARHDGHLAVGFRGYMGRIEAGQVRRGDKLLVQPGAAALSFGGANVGDEASSAASNMASGAASEVNDATNGTIATVKDIVSADGKRESACAGESVTLLFEEQLDISRGDLLTALAQPAHVLKTIEADICWLAEQALDCRHKYWLKHTTRQVAARVLQVDSLFDVNTQQSQNAHTVKLNDIARVTLIAPQGIAADAYDVCRATGAFILIDQITHQTVAAGMIRMGERR